MLHKKQRRFALLTSVVVASMLMAGCASQTGSPAKAGSSSDGGDYNIVLSNSYIGNAWRQTMVKTFEAAATEAKKQGLIKEFSVSNTSQNTATEQIAQIQSLILKKPSAILINSASPTALNSVIQQACSAGIVVVVFDSLATAKCEYDVVNDMVAEGYQEGHLVAEAMNGQGNMLVVRGVTGSLPDKLMYEGQMKALKEYPNIKVVKELVGQADDAVSQAATQSAIPGLPTIDGVVAQGAAYGVVQAFQSAGLPLPHVAFNTTGEALRYWKGLVDTQKYEGSGVLTDPGQASAALWVALALLNGDKVPKTTTLPIVAIPQTDLDAWIKVTPAGNVASWVWTQDQVNAAVKTNLDKGVVKAPPIPESAP